MTFQIPRDLARLVQRVTNPTNSPLPLSRRAPFKAYGLPSMLILLAGSFLLSNFTAVRYERDDSRRSYMTRDQLENLEDAQKDLSTTDIRELYFQLSEGSSLSAAADPYRTSAPDAASSPSLPKLPPKANRRPKGGEPQKVDLDNWENVRVERPVGTAEWGEAPKSWEEKKADRERKWV